MRKIPVIKAARLIARGTRSFHADRPLAVSFEVTHSCTANCLHCDKGGMKQEHDRMQPHDYRRMRALLKPMVAQVSGGEPLTRRDIVEVVRAIKEPTGLPYTILVTNGQLLTEEKYLELKGAGINQFSISLDFPNELHDWFRRSPGLYSHLEKLIPRLARHRFDDIVLNTAITRENLPYLLDIYEKGRAWGVSVSYSAYTMLRTGSQEHFISSEEDLKRLRETMQKLIALKRSNGRIVNSDWTLSGTYQFFKDGYVPGCNAGKRFLVVTPDGYLRPCSMHEKKYLRPEDILKEFVPENSCGGCYVAIRAYLNESFWTLLKDNVTSRVLRQKAAGNSCGG
ncbi:MAG TPA: radical SAM protein [Candidatus Acidoferrales bacterium]